MLKVVHNKKIVEVFNLCDIHSIKTIPFRGILVTVILFLNDTMYILNAGYSIEF